MTGNNGQALKVSRIVLGICSTVNTHSRMVFVLTTQQYTVIAAMHNKESLLLCSIHVLQMMHCQQMLCDIMHKQH